MVNDEESIAMVAQALEALISRDGFFSWGHFSTL